mmetsp:Transcript_40272/g.61453  ORF Transcript_40272/g.61453 Transcript_40272/m.61453 type:complete len:166 (-) Transcript_40272:4215-4712(-)
MFIFGIVILSAILMVFEDPLGDPNNSIFAWINAANQIITLIFISELIMKILVYGLLWNGDNSYLRNGWNILDCIIVQTSIASFVVESLTEGDEQSGVAQNLELLKMLRVLRSLRMISRNEGLKLSVLSLIYSMPGIMNVSLVTGLFYLLFGIFFLNMLKGKLFYC